MEEVVDDFIAMNQSGLVLELCEKYYDEKVLMMSEGSVFAESMREAYDKQRGLVESIKEAKVKMVSKRIEKNVSELIFHYKMTTKDSETVEFTGKHVQEWDKRKIIKETYQTID